MSFDTHAQSWDQPYRLERGKIIANEIRKNIKAPNGTALEFGAGTGIISFNLTDCFSSITAVDTSKTMIDRLAEKVAVQADSNIYPQKADIVTESLDEKYDVIYHSLVLHHIDNIQGIHEKFYDLLKPNGQLIFVDLHKEDGQFHANEPDFDGHNGFHPEDLGLTLESLGFDVESTKTFYEGTKEHNGIESPYSLFIISARKK